MRIIDGPGDLAEGAEWLCRREPRFAAAIRPGYPLPLRRNAGGFAALLDAIISQQVSVASAAAIHARLEAAGLTEAAAIARVDDDALRACGLSTPKIRYVSALACNGPDYGSLVDLPDHQVVAVLTALPGIGRWTAEIYAAFALGRADVLPAGDLALQEAARALFDLPKRPGERALRAMAEDWSPWRAVAARALWSYYRQIKGREGVGR